MKSLRKASVRTWCLAVTTAAGLAGPLTGHASLSASSDLCYSAAYMGHFVGNSCAYGSDTGQSAPGSIPGGSGVGSGVTAGGSSAGALQDYGVFHGYAKAAGTGVSGLYDSGGIRAGGEGQMSDSWILSGGTGFGYLTFGWTVTGQTALDGHPEADAFLLMTVQTAAGSQRSNNTLVIRQAGDYTVSRVPFYFGRPFEFDVMSSVIAEDSYQQGGGAYALYAAADFGHTSILSAIDAYDVNGNHIDGLKITAASGARYPVMVDAPGDPTPPPVPPAPPGTVPEPASVALLAVGLVAAAWTRRHGRPARAASARRVEPLGLAWA